MKKLLAILCTALATGSAKADTVQTLTVCGQTVEQRVVAFTFEGDQVTITFDNNSTRTEDMNNVGLAIQYRGEADGIYSTSAERMPSGPLYNLNGQRMQTDRPLSKGIYIHQRKKTIVK